MGQSMPAKPFSRSLQLCSKVLFLYHLGILKTTELFNVLDSVDSTNNYAMARVHEGLAKHGMAWFAREQTAGRGQPGKSWEGRRGQNIALTVVMEPAAVFFQKQFYFNAVIANTCYDFFKKYAGKEISIKWPNDIYWRDRKAGGILIENKLMGKSWKWAIVGIGINVNQEGFGNKLVNAVSLKQITGREYDPADLARELHQLIIEALERITEKDLPGILKKYNQHLFRKDEMVWLKKGKIKFETRIRKVNEYGLLITEDAMERQFSFGEVAWIL